MGSTNASASWEKIQHGVRDIERLISQKQFNLAMIKSRQVLEIMVRCLGERALIVEGDLVDTIDQLYENRWITKTTYEHYHRIRVLGNKAVHEGDDNPHDANQAYHILSQEILTFANEYAHKQRRRPQPAPASGKGRKRTKKSGFNPYDLLKPLAILVILILLALIIRFLVPVDDKKVETTTPPTTATVEETFPTETPETTEAEATNETVLYVVTGTNVNVRSEPSSSSDTIIGTLNKDDEVEYLGLYNDNPDWIKIKFNNKEACVAAQFLREK